MSSKFDATSFLDATTTEAAVKRELLHNGSEYIGEIGDVAARQNEGKKDPTKSYLFFDYPVKINLESSHPQEHARVGVPVVQLRYSVIVDLNEQTGAIDWAKGKNNQLRVLREATNTNVAGQPWNARQVIGKQIKVRIKHREYPEGSGEMVEDIAAISKI